MKLLSKIALCLCALTMAVASLNASVEQDDHSKVGDRCTYAELLAFRKARAQENEDNQAKIMTIPSEEHPMEQNDDEDRISAGWLFNPTLTHHGSHHHAVNLSPKGDTIELEDGSIWSAHHGSRTKDWLPEDILILTPNHAWFSSYDYRLTNQTTSSSAEVNITLGPILANRNVHRVFAIDSAKGIITLTDGSQWDMSWFDHSIVEEFMVNDYVILGHNDGWWKSFNPNILFNCATMKHARGSRVN